MGILDLLFPKYCVNCRKLGSYLCPNCFSFLSFDTYGICLVCDRPSFDNLTHPSCRNRYSIDGVFSGIVYKGVAKKLLYVFKYKPYLSDLQHFLSDLFYESLIQNETFHKALEAKPVVAPIPLSATKLQKRGYNQSEILSLGLARKLKLSSMPLLARVKNTRSQVGLKQKERRDNVQDAFSVLDQKQLLQAPQIILVDDILTTGATLLEAANVLKRAGAKKVWGITLAQD